VGAIRQIGEAAGEIGAVVATGYLAYQTAQNLVQDQEDYVTPATDVPGSTVHGDPLPTQQPTMTTLPLGDGIDQPTLGATGITGGETVGITVNADPLLASKPVDHIYLTAHNNHEVYIVRDPATNQVIYVGRTSQGLETRERQHQNEAGREAWELEAVRSGLTLEQARNYEQELIIRYGLNNLQNKRNEIAPSKWPEHLREQDRQ
jgi:hypothetical protein